MAFLLGLFQTKKTSVFFNLSLCFLLGIFASIFATWWIHPHYHDFQYFESDFLDYCYTLSTYDLPLEEPGSTYRSRLSGVSSYFLQPLLGTIDAIAVSSVIWTGICFSLLYLCGYLLHSSSAGIFVVMVALTIAPLHTMGRIINFYPTIIAILLLGCASFAYWSRRITAKRSVLLGLSIALLLLIDLRGILWATAYWFGAMLFISTKTPTSKWPKLLVCIHIPILLAWYIGQWSYAPNTTPLEHQTGFVYKNIIWGAQHLQERNLDGYVWGRSSLYSIVELFVFLFEESSKTSSVERSGMNLRDKIQYDYYMNVLLYYASLPCLLLLRKPTRLITLLICITPFALAWKGVQDAGIFHLRLYAQGVPILAILAGISTGLLIQHNPIKIIRTPHWVYYPLVLGISYCFMWGHIPNAFALNSPWHPRWFPKADELNRMNEMVLQNEGVQIKDERVIQCYDQILQENQPWVRTYNYGYQKLRFLEPPKPQRKKKP